jgi:hypothetical protein
MTKLSLKTQSYEILNNTRTAVTAMMIFFVPPVKSGVVVQVSDLLTQGSLVQALLGSYMHEISANLRLKYSVVVVSIRW